MTISVTMDDYPLIPAEVLNFDVTIVCPPNPVSVTEDAGFISSHTIDSVMVTSLPFALPTYTIVPSVCFSITSYTITDPANGNLPLTAPLDSVFTID